MAKSVEKNVKELRTKADNICPVCHDRMEIFAIGSCDHPVCFRCATRMRVLCKLSYCPICRADLQKIMLVHHQNKFDSIDTTSFCINRDVMMFFEDQEISNKYHELLQHRCKICTPESHFKDFSELRTHVQRQHQLFACELCINNVMLFSVDRKFYTRSDLAKHRSHGDEDDRSYRGHPLCKFCDERYFDNDELLRHLRKQHFFCHFCESDGITSEYFSDYPHLKDHFRDQHILCEEGECKEAQFTNAFQSKIDFQCHWTQKHSAGAGRQQAKQMRIIQFDYADTRRPQRGGASGGGSRYAENHDSDRRNRDRPESGGGGRFAENRDSDRRNRDRPESGGGGARFAENRDSDRRNKDRPESGTGGKQARDRKDAERKRREEYDQALALSASLAYVQKQGHISVIDPFLAQHSAMVSANSNASNDVTGQANYQSQMEDFPTLNNKGVAASGPCSQSDSDRQGGEGIDGSVQSDSLAQKLAMSSRQSVRSGTMNERDFPSLPNNVNSRKTVATSTWVSSSSKQAKKTSKTAWGTEGASGVVGMKEDFPQLCSSNSIGANSLAAVNNLVSSLSDISRSFSSGNLESMAGRGNSALPNSVSWGRDLNKQAKVDHDTKEHDGYLRLPTKNKSKQKSTDAKADKQKKAFKKSQALEVAESLDDLPQVAKTDGKVKFSNDSKLDAKDSIDDDFICVKNFGGKNAAKNEIGDRVSFGKFSILSDFPELPQKKPKESVKQNAQHNDAERHKTKPAKKNGKKQPSLGGDADMSKNKQNKQLKDSSNGKDERSSASLKTDDLHEDVLDVCPDMAQSEAASSVAFSIADEASSDDTAPQMNTTKSISFSNDEFPSLPVATRMFAVPSVTQSQVVRDVLSTRNTLEDVSAISATPTTFSQTPVPLALSDIASSIITSTKSSVTASAPPGFSANPKPSPPPGFEKPAIPVAAKLPPGFTSLPFETKLAERSTASYEVEKRLECASSLTASSVMEYIAPRGAKERGVRLFEAAAASLGSENLAGFRELSNDFRHGKISAVDYHERSRKMVGHEKFIAIFAELIVLLPDIPKQHELLQAHRDFLATVKRTGKSGPWSLLPSDNLALCVICSQVLNASDKREHESAHNFDSEFPVLLGATPCTVR